MTWETPGWFLDAVRAALGQFDLDPCSPSHNPGRVGAVQQFTQADNGLAQPWHGRVWVNPPYGRMIGDWMEKCRTEVTSGRAASVVALVPSRTDTRWWHDNVVRFADVFCWKGRLAFGDGSCPAPFPSALVCWGLGDIDRANLSDAFPDCWFIAAARVNACG